MNNQGLIYTRFPFSSIENMVLPGNLTDQETQLIHSLRVDVEKFNAIEWGKDIWDQQKSSSNNIFSRSLRENLNEVTASSPCLPHIGLGVVNIKFNNTSLMAIPQSMEKAFLVFFNFHRFCCQMDSSFLRYNSLS